MDYLLFTLAMIDHELAELALQDGRDCMEDRGEERSRKSVRRTQPGSRMHQETI